MEGWRIVEEGVCTPEDVDTAVKQGLGLRWAFMGPFETIDLNAPNGTRTAPLPDTYAVFNCTAHQALYMQPRPVAVLVKRPRGWLHAAARSCTHRLSCLLCAARCVRVLGVGFWGWGCLLEQA